MGRAFACTAALLLALAMVGPNPARAAGSGRYVVVFRPGVADPAAVATTLGHQFGFAIGHRYRYALQGFSAKLPAAALAGVSHNPNVAFVEADRPAELAQTLPTGVDRVDADLDPTAAIDGDPTTGNIDVPIAILDTGVDPDHPDLNVVGGTDCVPGDGKESYDDDQGHGTHVAGIAAARDDAGGVVGVAPGAPIWSIKVMPASGAGSWTDVLCGIDWVTAHAQTVPIANLSLSGPATSADSAACGDPLASAVRAAICASVAAGVTYAVAAGNQAADASNTIPASFDDVITVSAISDFDGQTGALAAGSYACNPAAISRDDSFACFSNWGSPIDIAAPGVAILSTALGGGTAVKSGTSMASPHVAGAVALYLAIHPGASPAAIRNGLLAASTSTTASLANIADPDGMNEPILNADFSGASPSPTSTAAATATRTATATPTLTPTATQTPMASPTNPSTPTSTATSPATATATPQPTFTLAPTASPTVTATNSPTETSTPIPTTTATPMPTPVATNTPQPVAPVISAISVIAGKTTATLTWTTDIPANSSVRFGIAGSLELVVSDDTLTRKHAVTLTGLTRRTVYSYIVESDAGGVSAVSDPATFRTR